MIRKLSSGQYRLYSVKINPKTGKRRNLGTFESREKAEKHMMEVHELGRSIVWTGERERAEAYVQQLHGYLLLATMEKSG